MILTVFILISVAQIFATEPTTVADNHVIDYVAKESWSKEEFPNPRTGEGARICSNNTDRLTWVCDPGQIMTQSERDEIDRTITRWHFVSECPCVNCHDSAGPYFPIMVAIIPQINDTKEEKAVKAIEDFSEYLRTETWNNAQCDDNIVIAISIGDKGIWTAAGKTAKSLLTDTCIYDIYDENKYLLASRIYSIALQNMVTEYIAVLNKSRECSWHFPKWIKYLAIAILGLLIILFCVDRISYFIFRRPLFYCFQKKKVSDAIQPNATIEEDELGHETAESSLHYHSNVDSRTLTSSSSLSGVDSHPIFIYPSQNIPYNDSMNEMDNCVYYNQQPHANDSVVHFQGIPSCAQLSSHDQYPPQCCSNSQTYQCDCQSVCQPTNCQFSNKVVPFIPPRSEALFQSDFTGPSNDTLTIGSDTSSASIYNKPNDKDQHKQNR